MKCVLWVKKRLLAKFEKYKTVYVYTNSDSTLLSMLTADLRLSKLAIVCLELIWLLLPGKSQIKGLYLICGCQSAMEWIALDWIRIVFILRTSHATCSELVDCTHL